MAEPDSNAPLCVTFRLRPGEFGAGIRRLCWELWWVRLAIVVVVVALLAGTVMAPQGNGQLLTILFGLAIVYALVLGWMLYLAPRRQYQRQALFSGEQTYCFSDTEVSNTFMGGGSHVMWSYFADMLETKALFILRHPNKRMGNIVPRRAFSSANEEARFRRLASRIGEAKGPVGEATT